MTSQANIQEANVALLCPAVPFGEKVLTWENSHLKGKSLEKCHVLCENNF